MLRKFTVALILSFLFCISLLSKSLVVNFTAIDFISIIGSIITIIGVSISIIVYLLQENTTNKAKAISLEDKNRDLSEELFNLKINELIRTNEELRTKRYRHIFTLASSMINNRGVDIYKIRLRGFSALGSIHLAMEDIITLINYGVHAEILLTKQFTIDSHGLRSPTHIFEQVTKRNSLKNGIEVNYEEHKSRHKAEWNCVVAILRLIYDSIDNIYKDRFTVKLTENHCDYALSATISRTPKYSFAHISKVDYSETTLRGGPRGKQAYYLKEDNISYDLYNKHVIIDFDDDWENAYPIDLAHNCNELLFDDTRENA